MNDKERIAELERQLAEAKAENAALTKQWNDLDLRTENRHREWSAAEASPSPERDKLKAACEPVVAEAKQRVDYQHDSWNPEAHVEMTITIAEIRAIDAAMQSDTKDE